MEAGQVSLLLWAIVVLFILLPLGYGISVLVRRNNAAFSKSRASYVKGFGIGFALIAAANGLQIVNSQRLPNGTGPWIDLVAEAVIAGLLFGAIGAWISRPRKQV